MRGFFIHAENVILLGKFLFGNCPVFCDSLYSFYVLVSQTEKIHFFHPHVKMYWCSLLICPILFPWLLGSFSLSGKEEEKQEPSTLSRKDLGNVLKRKSTILKLWYPRGEKDPNIFYGRLRP